MTTAKLLFHTWKIRFVQSESGCQDKQTFLNVVALLMAPASLSLRSQRFLFICGEILQIKGAEEQLMAGSSDSSRFKSLDKPIEEYIPTTKTKTRAENDRDLKLLTAFYWRNMRDKENLKK